MKLLLNMPGIIFFYLKRDQDRKILNARTRTIRAGVLLKFLLVTPPVLYAFWVFFCFIFLSILHVDIGDLSILLHHFQALSKLLKSDSENTLFLKSISKKGKKEKSKSNSKKQKNSEKYGINDLVEIIINVPLVILFPLII